MALSSKPPGDDVVLTAPADAEISNDGGFVISQNGEYFAAGGAAPDQSKLYVWNITTGQLQTTLDLPSGQQAFALGFTANDQALVAFSGAKTKIYEIALSTGQRTPIGTDGQRSLSRSSSSARVSGLGSAPVTGRSRWGR